MKKTLLLAVFLFAICLTWCTSEQAANTTVTENNSWAQGLFLDNESGDWYKVKMQKPSFSDMENWEAVQKETYDEPRTTEYSISEDDVELANECEKITFYPYNNYSENSISLTKNEIIEWRTITVTWTYNWYNPYPLTWNVIDQIKKNGFWVTEFKNEYIWPSYEEEYWVFSQEEWVSRIREIGGSEIEYQRFPFNTLFVTNDLLLHSFHKIFDNELQYYEETQARPILAKLSETMFNIFSQWKWWKDKEKNKFLAAYWAIPHALLPSNEELKKAYEERESKMWEVWYGDEIQQAEFNDDELKAYLDKRFNTILKKVDSKYKSALNEAWKNIWEASNTDLDILLAAYAPDFIAENSIYQDYTQFRPRSHYNNSTFLKTYFMGMKWLMREKFYYWDKTLAETSLYLVNAIPEENLAELNQLQQAILVLIWSDDDTTIWDVKDFMAKENLWDNLSLNEEQYKALKNLKHQRITSATYSRDEAMVEDENEAKEMLDGFVFFWEKFTLDSYIFDLLTAGSAEIQFLKKPNIQTSLIVPDVLENYSPANELVTLWLNEKAAQEKVFENVEFDAWTAYQVSSYNNEKTAAQWEVEQEMDESLLKTVYHTWLKMLWKLFTKVENVPYFKEVPAYIFKNLWTYLGSYTELKHDTLLYVKQAYAEMWAGWMGMCDVTIYPPELPVPKGYIEADVAFIDALIQLNDTTKVWFTNSDNFIWFWEYLAKIRELVVKQMNNEVISDEEFEWLRLSYNDLNTLTQPKKLFWEAWAKEERWAIIADIFTSEWPNPLYEAVGRPLLMALMVKDANGARIVLGPIFSHYEFYQSDRIIEWDQRYTDTDWQSIYDSLSPEDRMNAYWIETRKLFEELDK